MNFLIRVYPPMPESVYEWARCWRALIHLENGSHVHALPDRDGILKVTTRDILRGKISNEAADTLNAQLRKIEAK